jgi:hypothetical protein
MTSRYLPKILEAYFEAEARDAALASGPLDHPQRTESCPALTRFRAAAANGWSPAERAHAGQCAYCRKVMVMQRECAPQAGAPDSELESARRAAGAGLLAAASDAIREKLQAWIGEQRDFLAAAIRVVGSAPVSLALEPAMALAGGGGRRLLGGGQAPTTVFKVGGPEGYEFHVDPKGQALVRFPSVAERQSPPNVYIHRTGAPPILARKLSPKWEANTWIVPLVDPPDDYCLVITPNFES